MKRFSNAYGMGSFVGHSKVDDQHDSRGASTGRLMTKGYYPRSYYCNEHGPGRWYVVEEADQ